MEENIVMQAREQAGKKVVNFINEGKFPEALNFLNEYKTLEPMLFSLTQAPKSNPVESNSVKSNSEEPHLNLKLPLPEAKDAFGMQDNFDDNDMKVKSVVTKKNSSPEPKEYSLSKQVVWDFVIEYLINNKFECKATDLADAFKNKYEYQFNSFDMKIRTSKDKRGNRDRQIVSWKQRLWQVTSEMRRNHIIIGGKDNLYILAPKHRPE
jgi:hypothetical protein